MDELRFPYGLTVKKIAECLGKAANNKMLQMDITASQFHVLRALEDAEDQTLSLKALESTFSMAQSTIAGLVNRLEKKQLVEPVTVCDDKRVKHICLTNAGRELLRRAFSGMVQLDQSLIQNMTPQEAAAFRELLMKAYNSVKDK